MSRRKTVEPDPEALERLREWCPRGSTVYCTMKHWPYGSLSRHISLLRIYPEPPPTGYPDGLRVIHLDRLAAPALGLKFSEEREAIQISGAGMDMGLCLVGRLADLLYGSERALEHRWL